eukprot:g1811.t1
MHSLANAVKKINNVRSADEVADETRKKNLTNLEYLEGESDRYIYKIEKIKSRLKSLTRQRKKIEGKLEKLADSHKKVEIATSFSGRNGRNHAEAEHQHFEKRKEFLLQSHGKLQKANGELRAKIDKVRENSLDVRRRYQVHQNSNNELIAKTKALDEDAVTLELRNATLEKQLEETQKIHYMTMEHFEEKRREIDSEIEEIENGADSSSKRHEKMMEEIRLWLKSDSTMDDALQTERRKSLWKISAQRATMLARANDIVSLEKDHNKVLQGTKCANVEQIIDRFTKHHKTASFLCGKISVLNEKSEQLRRECSTISANIEKKRRKEQITMLKKQRIADRLNIRLNELEDNIQNRKDGNELKEEKIASIIPITRQIFDFVAAQTSNESKISHPHRPPLATSGSSTTNNSDYRDDTEKNNKNSSENTSKKMQHTRSSAIYRNQLRSGAVTKDNICVYMGMIEQRVQELYGIAALLHKVEKQDINEQTRKNPQSDVLDSEETDMNHESSDGSPGRDQNHSNTNRFSPEINPNRLVSSSFDIHEENEESTSAPLSPDEQPPSARKKQQIYRPMYLPSSISNDSNNDDESPTRHQIKHSPSRGGRDLPFEKPIDIQKLQSNMTTIQDQIPIERPVSRGRLPQIQ